jgi:hypothetical protein
MFVNRKQTPNQAMQRTATRAASNAVNVCDFNLWLVARFGALAMADLVSR